MRLIRYDVLRLASGKYKAYAWGETNWFTFSSCRSPNLRKTAVPGQERKGYVFHEDAFFVLDTFLHDKRLCSAFEKELPRISGQHWSLEIEPVVNRYGAELIKTDHEMHDEKLNPQLR
jgi:hypothetical protein